MIGHYIHTRIDQFHFFLCTLYFCFAYIRGKMDYLTLQITKVHYIGIHDTNSTYTCCRKIQGGRCSQSASSYHKDFTVEYFLLTFHTHILQENMATVAFYLFFAEFYHCAPPPIKYRKSILSPSLICILAHLSRSANSSLICTETISGCVTLFNSISSFRLSGKSTD